MKHSVRSYSIVLLVLAPLWLFCWLAANPPHALDLALARPFYDGGGWPLHAQGWIELLLHKIPKFISGAAALYAVAIAFFAWAERRDAKKFPNRPFDAEANAFRLSRALYMIAAMLACLTIVWLLKRTTGVSCPWSVIEFGGRAEMTEPVFGLSFIDGKCWPGGAAGSGFCLFAAYFALRDARPKLAFAAGLAALAIGWAAGIGRQLAGAHFLSHNIASMALDWLLCGAIYILCFDSRGALEKLKAILPHLRRPAAPRFLTELSAKIRRRPAPAAPVRPEPHYAMTFGAFLVFTALWWTVFFDAPLMMKLAGVGQEPSHAAALSPTLAAASAAAFALVAAALVSALSMLPNGLWRVLMLILHTCGAVSLTAAVLYGVVMTPDMVRNFLATDTHEAMGYLSPRTAATFLLAWIPGVWATLVAAPAPKLAAPKAAGLTSGARVRATSLRVLRRAGLSLGCLAAGVACIGLNFQAFAGAMRSDKSLRYQIAPVNVVYAGVWTVARDESPDGPRVRLVTDPAPRMAVNPDRPTVFVVFVGETARSANWQLSGYARQTTPRLAAEPGLISFPAVSACGTSTDVSLPCFMSRIGRRDYSRSRILAEEALPDVLQRAGWKVTWIDNQSGCKGVCAGVPSRGPNAALGDKTLCPNGRCYDGIFVKEIEKALTEAEPGKPQVLFLHMMGSHGPAYAQRSPAEDKAYGPECTASDLGSCSRAEVVNAYDNSIRYTDKVLAASIDALRAAQGVDTGLLFLSDHGESLGEKGLYLHGAPYWMAPDEQVKVPMAIWLSEGFRKDFSVDESALRSAAAGSVSQDAFYHTILGLLKVQSTTYEGGYDLSKANLSAPAAAPQPALAQAESSNVPKDGSSD